MLNQATQYLILVEIANTDVLIEVNDTEYGDDPQSDDSLIIIEKTTDTDGENEGTDVDGDGLENSENGIDNFYAFQSQM